VSGASKLKSLAITVATPVEESNPAAGDADGDEAAAGAEAGASLAALGFGEAVCPPPQAARMPSSIMRRIIVDR
jgi:hypothetical protein